MSIPKDHHFVPKVYLKEFANSQKQLYQLIKGNTNISIKSIGQICYKPHYFKFHLSDSLILQKIKDPNYIEKNVFKKQENLYPKLVKKITFPYLSSHSLLKSETFFFLETLITIKRRNPTYREQIIEFFKKHVTSEQFKKQAELGFEISRLVDKIDPEIYFENYIKEATTNKDKQSDFYLESFIDKQNKATETAAELLFRFKIYIYHAPWGSEFITSDNPGFTVFPDGNLSSFGGFGVPFTFIFPLTPKCCLYITHQQIDGNFFNLTKDIYVAYADKNFIDTVNEGTYKLAVEKMFSYSKHTLKSFTK